LSENPRILHLITTLERGGAEKQLLVLVTKQIQSGADVKVAYLKGQGSLKVDFEKAGAQVLPPNHFNLLITLLKLIRMSQSVGPHIVHSHLPRAEIVGRVLILFTNSKFIVSRHNSESFFPKSYNLVSSSLSRWVLLRAHCIICISEATRDFMIKNREIPEGVLERIRVIRYGFDDSFEPAPKGFKFKYCIGTISRLSFQKNITIQIEALDILRKQSKAPWNLRIIGSGPLEVNLRKRVTSLGLDKYVNFVSHVSDVSFALSEIDIFVLSSIYEGFGLVLLEAMQSNTPILASNVSAIPEVLGKDYAGLFNPRDPKELATLILHLEEFSTRKSFTDSLKKRLSLFEPDMMCKAVMSAYE